MSRGTLGIAGGGGSASLLSLTSPTFCHHLQCLEAPYALYILLNITHVFPLMDNLPQIFAPRCAPCITHSNHIILFDRAFLNICNITSKPKEHCGGDGKVHNTSREESFE